MADDRKPELVLAFSTAGSSEEARRIASVLVADELAACVNLVDGIESIYLMTYRLLGKKRADRLVERAGAEQVKRLRQTEGQRCER
jgi:uncharacterized protein involved in tolerance to divalent cations